MGWAQEEDRVRVQGPCGKLRELGSLLTALPQPWPGWPEEAAKYFKPGRPAETPLFPRIPGHFLDRPTARWGVNGFSEL